MNKSWTIDDVLERLPLKESNPIPAPEYVGTSNRGIGLAVESMKRHMTDEGWQIFAGLEYTGYTLCGYDLPFNSTDVPYILDHTRPGIVVVQDKREWDVQRGNFRDPQAKFVRIKRLQARPDLFKVTILKDAHQNNPYHRESAEEMGCHAWIVYYNKRVVQRHAPFVRPEHLIRVYHTIDPRLIPPVSCKRHGTILSGAISGVYPLRSRLVRESYQLPQTDCIRHPGYHRNGCATPSFLQTLTNYKVAICTASCYGYVLRKIIEATACGCIVLTDLPSDEIVPRIDGNLVRVHPDTNTSEISNILCKLYADYDPNKQAHYANEAKWFDFRAAGVRLANDIERLRSNYVSHS